MKKNKQEIIDELRVRIKELEWAPSEDDIIELFGKVFTTVDKNTVANFAVFQITPDSEPQFVYGGNIIAVRQLITMAQSLLDKHLEETDDGGEFEAD